MTPSMKAAFASLAVALAAGAAATANAADLGDYPRGGSIKDGYMPAYTPGPSGPCYFRADVGYSWSRDPSATWPVSNLTIDNTTTPATTTTTYVGDSVSSSRLEDTWFGAAGAGCGSASRGIRGEVMFGYHGSRKFEGKPNDFTITTISGGGSTPDLHDDPLHTSITSYTMMFNAYKDLGTWRGLTPYVGAGIGMAYNVMDDVYFTGNPNLVNRIHGASDLSFAWSLMAGVGYQISDRTTIDFGYRYMDFGKAASERSDSGGFVNPRVKLDDIAAHEFKIGVRYAFGGCCDAGPGYGPLK